MLRGSTALRVVRWKDSMPTDSLKYSTFLMATNRLCSSRSATPTTMPQISRMNEKVGRPIEEVVHYGTFDPSEETALEAPDNPE